MPHTRPKVYTSEVEDARQAAATTASTLLNKGLAFSKKYFSADILEQSDIVQHGPSMTSWLIHTLFVLVDPYPFNAVKRVLMDRPKQKRVWINQDVIGGPHCMSC